MIATPVMLMLQLLGAPSVHEFVCTRTQNANSISTGPALTWATRQLTYNLSAQGTNQLDPAGTFAVLRSAFAVWQNLTLDPSDQGTCGSGPQTDLKFVEGPMTEQSWVGYNYLDPNSNRNVLLFRDDNWPYASLDDNSADIIALTTSTYSFQSGRLLDADIEFNSANKTFVISDPSLAQQTYDLLNTAVHEIGHFIGMAHCTDPTCDPNGVMIPMANPGDINKRTLKCGDRAGIVFKYPKGLPNGYCTSTVDYTCGNCAAPLALSFTPTIAMTAQGTGRQTCSCAPGGLNTVLTACWCLQRWRRSRQRAA